VGSQGKDKRIYLQGMLNGLNPSSIGRKKEVIMKEQEQRVNERLSEARLRLICNGEPSTQETVNIAIQLSKCRIEIVKLCIKDSMELVKLAETENNKRGIKCQ